jgi:hypothetical protein
MRFPPWMSCAVFNRPGVVLFTVEMSGIFNKPTLSPKMNQMTGRWGAGAEKHSVLFWLIALAAFFIVVVVMLMLI